VKGGVGLSEIMYSHIFVGVKDFDRAMAFHRQLMTALHRGRSNKALAADRA
jgi:hypothetical protein